MGEASAAEVFEDIERPDERYRSKKGEKRYVSTSANKDPSVKIKDAR